MTLIQAIISGVVQGITEFLPVSSSGHLVLLHRYFNLVDSGAFFDICLHVGTLAAVIVYFRKDIFLIIRERKYLWLSCITVGTVPAVGAALLFEKNVESFFSDPRKVVFMFFITALALFAGQLAINRNYRRATEGKDMNLYSSLFVGLAQALALLPGVSRSGMTISAGLIHGMKKETAFRFSFLLSIPVIAGAMIYKMFENAATNETLIENSFIYASGMITAFLVGLASLPLLLKTVKEGKLYIFGLYCLVLGAGGVFFVK